MGENIHIDSHKLIYHPQRVADWMSGKNIYPLEVEISPSGACNHRCVFCSFDYLQYKASFLEKDVILRAIKKLKNNGLKSVVCAGEGEPLLNKDMPEMANVMKDMGLSVAMSTNGVYFTEDIANECIGAFTWIRFSVASLEEKSYYSIQGAKNGDYEKVKSNLENAVNVKRKLGVDTTIGVQCLLLEDNMEQLPRMAEMLREIGVDYLTVKPYMQHKQSNKHIEVDYSAALELEEKLKKYETESFSVYFRANAMKKLHKQKPYKKCLGLPFMAHIDSKGNVWPCCGHIGNERFKYGNIYDEDIEEIWEGEKRKNAIAALNNADINKVCFEACHMDSINQYLDELVNPGRHVNFI